MTKGKCYVNILVHGLFFMEFDAEGVPLTLTAPSTGMHKYCCGRNGFVFTISAPNEQVTLDLINDPIADLASGQERSFKSHPEVPQISKLQAGTGNIDSPGALQILLPYPDQIIPFRLGKMSDFDYVTSPGRLKDSILASGADNFALVTCFRFQRKNPFYSPANSTYSFYAEHDHDTTPTEVDQAYTDADDVFENHFGLHLNGNEPKQTYIPPDNNPGYDIWPGEECSLAELKHGPPPHRAINVANCVQFGINP